MKVVMKKLLIAIFVMSVSVVGCDVPYSGPILTVNDVDRYLKSMDEDTVCVQDGFDSVCLRVVLKEKEDEREEIRVVHIHPTGVMYGFYYEDRLVLRAERAMDTTRIAQELIEKCSSRWMPNNWVLAVIRAVMAMMRMLLNDGSGGCESGFVVWTGEVNGNKQSGVICKKYTMIDEENNTIIFTGADGKVDGGNNESTKKYVKVETGYTYEEAIDRAPKILREWAEREGE